MADYDWWAGRNYPANYNQGYFNYPHQIGDQDYEFAGNRNPTSWTYEEYWNIPGPFVGVGPRGYVRSDEDIEKDVNSRLADNGQLDASDIEVAVDNHEVTLNGSVDSRRSKRLAEDIAETVFGVEDIHNNLRVRKQEQAQRGTRSGQVTGKRPTNLREGEQVVGSKGNKLGTIKEIHNNDLLLSRPTAPDVHVPFTAIQDTSGNQVKLNVAADQVDKQGWQHI